LRRRRATATPDVAVVPARVLVPAALSKYNGPAVGRLLMVGNRSGYVTLDEANDVLPISEISSEEIEAVLEAIFGLGIKLTER
jgi:RNA polymerase primary sigma factor